MPASFRFRPLHLEDAVVVRRLVVRAELRGRRSSGETIHPAEEADVLLAPQLHRSAIRRCAADDVMPRPHAGREDRLPRRFVVEIVSCGWRKQRRNRSRNGSQCAPVSRRFTFPCSFPCTRESHRWIHLRFNGGLPPLPVKPDRAAREAQQERKAGGRSKMRFDFHGVRRLAGNIYAASRPEQSPTSFLATLRTEASIRAHERTA